LLAEVAGDDADYKWCPEHDGSPVDGRKDSMA
jgi:hypothetical protein